MNSNKEGEEGIASDNNPTVHTSTALGST